MTTIEAHAQSATEPAPSWTIAAADLRSALDRVKHAAADDEARPILAAILIEQRGFDIRVVAADNYRIAQVTIPSVIDEVAFEWAPAVLPIRELPTVLAFLRAQGKTGYVSVERAAPERLRLTGRYGSAEVVLISGTYPNTDEIADQVAKLGDPKHSVALNAAYLADIKRGISASSAGIVKVFIADPLAPVVFTSGDDYRETIMPVKTL